ncbi:MAG TPA: DUF1573 domain-containing protein [Bacillota bacterium]|nr:DUF1573 domain-containing protein [Bacillota bacterium]
MKDILCDEFQNTVSELLIRHQSVLDILSKSQEACARTNRAVVKAVTSCGCIQIEAGKKSMPDDADLADLKTIFESHVKGELCENCRDIIEDELGRTLFYMAALCNQLNLNMYDIFIKENKKMSTLRVFNFR